MLRRRGLGGRLQVVHHLPRRHPDLHQVLPAHGRVRPLRGRQALLHTDHQQVWDQFHFITRTKTQSVNTQIKEFIPDN